MHIEVPNLPRAELRQDAVRESSAEVRTRVIAARKVQLERGGKPNNLLSNREIEQFCRLNEADERLLDNAMEQLGLSARAWYRILKVARTIADLAGKEDIQTLHLTEAITYRRLERKPV
ncbi:Mg chelatase-related protein [Beggiatoa sp. PS]|nr:Mg chelatase-related protein [Beggiatoa sp. PS]